MTILFFRLCQPSLVFPLDTFFPWGGNLSGVQRGIAEYTVEGYNERAFISMNQQQVTQLEIDDGNTIQVLDIDSNKPFAIVFAYKCGNHYIL